MNHLLEAIVVLIFIMFLHAGCSSKKKVENDSENHDGPNMEAAHKTDTQESGNDQEPKSEDLRSNIQPAELSTDTLLGRWLRPDGNYILQINSIHSDNSIDAEYFNPRPIRVARAERLDDDRLRIFVEFDDRGYEGSSYDLVYDPINDALSGKYFQATYGQTYQIAFVRLEE